MHMHSSIFIIDHPDEKSMLFLQLNGYSWIIMFYLF